MRYLISVVVLVGMILISPLRDKSGGKHYHLKIFAQTHPVGEKIDDATPKLLDLDETGSALLKKIDPCVVTIRHERGLGSGYIVSSDGYIITNGHVVSLRDRDNEDPMETARFITVIMFDEKKYKAKVIGHSLDPDVALIKIESETTLPAIELGNSDIVKAGQRVYAYGSPGGLKRTLTAGILSNIERTDLRTFTRVFQTDAPINPGNSGGPLLNEKGEVIGMNTYGGGGEGIGFAIPINVIKVMREHFLKYGRFKRADLPVFFIRHLDDDLSHSFGVDKGLLVNYVEENSYIYQQGLRTSDIIREIDSKEVSARTEAELLDIVWELTGREVGSKITLKVLRPTFSDAGGSKKSAHSEHIISAVMMEDEPAVEYGYQSGEIKELRYDDLGLGVKLITAQTQYYYNLPHRQGVRIVRVQPNSASARAELQVNDIITHINNRPVKNVDDFQKELEQSLVLRQKLISLGIQRGNLKLNTALKPFYDLVLQDKPLKILVFLPQEAEYFDLIRRFLIINGAEFTTVSDTTSDITVDKLVEGLTQTDFDGVILMTGKGIKDYWNNKNLQGLVRYCLDNKKVIGAIGGASVVLINADAKFLSRKLTTAEEYSSVMLERKGNYTGKEVQTDGAIITTTGFDTKTVKSFLNTYKGVLRNLPRPQTLPS
ncbi:MAG: trypsin-like peptidase domain-containing protein, partial [Planctomycetota bacterium]|nr:trypsin-like peptidase domain-containing protein [Planctomycetota bacterium]